MNIPTFLTVAGTGMRHSRNSVNDLFGAWLGFGQVLHQGKS